MIEIIRQNKHEVIKIAIKKICFTFINDRIIIFRAFVSKINSYNNKKVHIHCDNIQRTKTKTQKKKPKIISILWDIKQELLRQIIRL